MRNLVKYPLTAAEASEILRSLSLEELMKERIGDMQPYALEKVAEFIEQNADKFNEFVGHSLWRNQ